MTSTPIRAARVIAAAGAAFALTIGLAGCTSTVAKDDVAKSIKVELDKEGVAAGPVNGPQDLTAEVGQSLRCSYDSSDGQPVDAVAKVTSIDGDTARYDITTEARPVASTLLARKVGDLVTKDTGEKIDSTVCDRDLQPTVGDAETCTIKAGTESLPLKITVTSTANRTISFSYEKA